MRAGVQQTDVERNPHKVKVTCWASRSRPAQDQSLPPRRGRKFPSSQPPQSTIALSAMYTNSIPVSREAAGQAYFFSTPNRRSKKSEEIQANNVEQTVVDPI